MLKSLLLAVLCLGVSSPLCSQVIGSGQEHAGWWYAGAEYSRLNPDYWDFPTAYMHGLAVYGGHNFYVQRQTAIGLEGTWRTLLARRNGTQEEDTFLVSGRYIFRFYRFAPFIKGGGGFGHFSAGDGNPNPGQNGFHLVGAIGAGGDIRLTSHVYIRPLEYEQQVWSFSPHFLAPHSWSFGAAWRFR